MKNLNHLYKEILKKNSEEIKNCMKESYPQRTDSFDSLNFKFVEQKGSNDKSFLYIDIIINEETDIRVNVNDLSPLYVDSLIEGLKIERALLQYGLETFVSFVKEFDPQAINKPPQRKELQILLKWFLENVISEVKVLSIEGKKKNNFILSWTDATFEGEKHATIPEGSTLKDLASVILTTGKLQSFKRRKNINLEDRS